MKISKNILIGALTLLTVVATGVAWRSYWQARWLEAAQVEDEDITALQTRLRAAEDRNHTLEAQLAASRETSTATDDASAAPAPAPREGGRGFGRGGPPAAVRAALDRPEMQRLRTMQQKAALDARYAPLFKSLNLEAAKLDQFKTLLAEREATTQDVMMAARDQGLDPRRDREAVAKLVASAQSEIDTQLKSLLGDDGFAHYEQYAKTQTQRATVEQLRQSLSYTSEPLSDTQATQLVQILAANTPVATDGTAAMLPPDGGGGRGGRGPGGATTVTAPITTAAVTAAQAVLTTAQVQTLQQMQTLQQAQQQVMQLIRSAEAAGPVGATAATTGNRGRS
ncbi:MAG: hypothetical protein HZA93_03595 [Verrucomicrobia bacterium]|nr:hypothetical protein [Verrucomicrobiota bacterium]